MDEGANPEEENMQPDKTKITEKKRIKRLKFIDPNGNFTWVIPLTQGLWAATAAILTGAGAWAAKKGVDHINEERDRRRTEEKPPFSGTQLGNDPTQCPAPGFEWKGNGPP